MFQNKLCNFIAPYFLGVGIGLIISVLFTGCGSGPADTPKVGGPGSPAVINVSLDDAFTTIPPNGSEKVELLDSRYFTPPASILVLQGPYQGSNPSQNLHGRLFVGIEQCEYLGTGITAQFLSLQSCSGSLAPNTLLPSGTVIELSNYDAPGFLLQTNFTLSL